eukprot:3711095-Lingulodinium_polyedra.AAC.1
MGYDSIVEARKVGKSGAADGLHDGVVAHVPHQRARWAAHAHVAPQHPGAPLASPNSGLHHP